MPSFSSADVTSIYSPRAKDLTNFLPAIPLWTTSASVTSTISPLIISVPLSTDTSMSSLENPAIAREI